MNTTNATPFTIYYSSTYAHDISPHMSLAFFPTSGGLGISFGVITANATSWNIERRQFFPRFRGNSSTQTYDMHESAVGLPAGVANGESGPHEGIVCSQRQRMRPRDGVVTVQRKERC